mgnify:CR=1 FL=1
MSKNVQAVSLCFDPITKSKLDKHSKKRKLSVSALVRDLVDKQLPSEDENVDIIILKIPDNIKSDSETLKTWLDKRVEFITKALTNCDKKE